MNFAKELIKLRKSLNLSQEALGEKLACSRSYICKLESGNRIPNLELINKISDSLKLDTFEKNKFLIISNIKPEFSNSNEEYRSCLKLALYLKDYNPLLSTKLINYALDFFQQTVEVLCLKANLALIHNDFSEALKYNQEALKEINQLSTKSITQSEIIHNIGYVYYERALKYKKYYEQNFYGQRFSNNKGEINNSELDSALEDFKTASHNFEKSYQNDSSSHIANHLAGSYLNLYSLQTNKDPKLLESALELYDLLLKKVDNQEKAWEYGMFTALILAKQQKSTESLRIINLVLGLKDNLTLIYAKACIYSISAVENSLYLKEAFKLIEKLIKKDSSYIEDIKFDPDLENLFQNETYKNKLIKLLS